jgi:hypothetical protein
MAALIQDTREMSYLVLTDRAIPYLLARLRWPDVAQAITVSRTHWLEDPGLFDLHYDSSAVNVSFSQAASVAAGWGVQLSGQAADGGRARRPRSSNGSDISRRERRTWSLEIVGQRRRASGYGASVGVERRGHPRVRIDGRAHVRSGLATISASLVDLSQGGVRFMQPEAPSALAAGATLDGPFLFEADRTSSRICLDVAGRIVWRRSIGAGTHFGVAFSDLADAEAEGLQSFLAAAHS